MAWKKKSVSEFWPTMDLSHAGWRASKINMEDQEWMCDRGKEVTEPGANVKMSRHKK